MNWSPSGSSVFGISRQEYQNELSLPSLGDVPDLEIEPESPASPPAAGGFFAASATREAPLVVTCLRHSSVRVWMPSSWFTPLPPCVLFSNKFALYVCECVWCISSLVSLFFKIPHIGGIIRYLCLSGLLHSAWQSRSIISWAIFHCVYAPHLCHSFACQWTHRLLSWVTSSQVRVWYQCSCRSFPSLSNHMLVKRGFPAVWNTQGNTVWARQVFPGSFSHSILFFKVR